MLEIGTLSGPGHLGVRVWDPADGSVKLLPLDMLLPIADAPPATPAAAVVVATVARIHAAISRNVLLAPLDTPVIPLPHQIAALSRAMQRAPFACCWRTKWGWARRLRPG